MVCDGCFNKEIGCRRLLEVAMLSEIFQRKLIVDQCEDFQPLKGCTNGYKYSIEVRDLGEEAMEEKDGGEV